ncbi:superoxide dismutase family protein [Gymnodinialimonas ulvae]|uniref:superoxide dismutase family protein n=1 Tax=Gymnodinialimonas ulvae TaxID=3126504 RepID=UPI0030A73DB4
MKFSNALMRGLALSMVVGVSGQMVVADGHAITANATLNNLDGAAIGLAEITQTPHGVLVHVRVSDLPPGAKGIHFHRTAHCAADDGFTSSHGHHGEGEGEHGLLNAAGPGQGDLGNIFLGTDGVGEMQFFKDGVFLTGSEMALMDEDGTAIVIHAEEDDQISQPIGGAGARIVCGIVEMG